MKKHLLNLSLLVMAASFGFAQNKANDFSTRGTTFQKPTQASYKNSILLPAPATTLTSCMSVNLPTPATWTLTNYGTGTPVGTNGWVNGVNQYLDKEKAMYFDVSASANTLLTQVYLGFGLGYSATPTKTVGVKIYDGTGGTVGAQIGTTRTITMAEIMADVNAGQYSLVIFPTPVTLPASKQFFVSMDISGLQWAAAAHDTLNLLSNVTPQTNPTPVWEKWSDNTWHRYTTSGSWNLNVSLLIHPFLTQAPINATFSVSNHTICAGQSVSYNSAGSTAGTYEWDFGAIPTPTATGATSSATYPSAGTYTTIMIVSDACGSLGAVQDFITVNANPNVTASPSSTTVCSGANITLNGGGATSYTWTGGVTNGSSAPAVAGSYTVTGTAANGCTNTAVSNVVVNTLPTVTANTSTNTICSGSSVNLNGGGASTYTWQPGSLANGSSVSPTGNSTYTVTGTDVNGCINTATAAVTVNTLPTVSANATETVVCAGDNVTLTGGGATTYTWSGTVVDGNAFAPSATNTYTVTGTDANGCNNTAMVTVDVNTLPSVTANATSTVVCAGNNVTLTGGGATTYTWSGTVVDGAAFAPASTDTYTVNGTDGNGCENSATVTVDVNTLPSVTANASATLICTGDNVTLTGGGATTYTWSGTVVDGASFAPTSTDTYTVTGSDVNGCEATSTVEVVVDLCTGIKNLSQVNTAVVVYPNPNNGSFTIRSVAEETIAIVNELGQTIGTVELNYANNFSYNAGNLQSGIYFVVGKTAKVKVLVTR